MTFAASRDESRSRVTGSSHVPPFGFPASMPRRDKVCAFAFAAVISSGVRQTSLGIRVPVGYSVVQALSDLAIFATVAMVTTGVAGAAGCGGVPAHATTDPAAKTINNRIAASDCSPSGI
jgi:hypothetical protein